MDFRANIRHRSWYKQFVVSILVLLLVSCRRHRLANDVVMYPTAASTVVQPVLVPQAPALQQPVLQPSYNLQPVQTGFTAVAESTPNVAPVDDRTPGQIVADTLHQQGFSCTAEDDRWRCLPSTERNWSVYVSYQLDGGTPKLLLDSYADRSFGKRCFEFTQYVEDLQIPSESFTVICDDNTHRYRMSTTLTYAADLDIVGWVRNHLSNRKNSFDLLRSVSAVR